MYRPSFINNTTFPVFPSIPGTCAIPRYPDYCPDSAVLPNSAPASNLSPLFTLPTCPAQGSIPFTEIVSSGPMTAQCNPCTDVLLLSQKCGEKQRKIDSLDAAFEEASKTAEMAVQTASWYGSRLKKDRDSLDWDKQHHNMLDRDRDTIRAKVTLLRQLCKDAGRDSIELNKEKDLCRLRRMKAQKEKHVLKKQFEDAARKHNTTQQRLSDEIYRQQHNSRRFTPQPPSFQGPNWPYNHQQSPVYGPSWQTIPPPPAVQGLWHQPLPVQGPWQFVPPQPPIEGSDWRFLPYQPPTHGQSGHFIPGAPPIYDPGSNHESSRVMDGLNTQGTSGPLQPSSTQSIIPDTTRTHHVPTPNTEVPEINMKGSPRPASPVITNYSEQTGLAEGSFGIVLDQFDRFSLRSFGPDEDQPGSLSQTIPSPCVSVSELKKTRSLQDLSSKLWSV